MTFMPYDLFGEIPVTDDEIFQWVAAMSPRNMSSERSYQNYVRNWNVAEKIRAAKQNGTFHEIISRPYQPWHGRLSLVAIA